MSASTEQDPLGKLPVEIREWIFGLIFRVEHPIHLLPAATNQQLSTTPASQSPRLATAILRLNKQYNIEALKVLRKIPLRLNLEQVCATHNNPASATTIQQCNASQGFRDIQLSITNPRSDCGGHCVVNAVRSLINSQKHLALRTVDVIQHTYRRPGFATDLVTLLRNQNIAIRFAKVGCISSTATRPKHSQIQVNFIWPAVKTAFSIIAGMSRQETEQMQNFE
ncbi:hypothetical protein LTR10_000162 [Elasticomyces elasticus]|nr:hypothetical protein LTR10_000162 [Elasticomyces elasticus]KAK4980580.1 hypothetical protein LTR42_000888 [Elasticomyces elasticus]